MPRRESARRTRASPGKGKRKSPTPRNRSRSRASAKSECRTERLNKVLARAGIRSRRGADALIAEGRVTVNGRSVREMGVRVDPARDTIRVDGERIPGFPRNHTYLLLNKPRGFVTTLADPRGRPTVLDLLRGVERRVFPVGRLDFNSEGLLLLTDDGELARTLMHPASEVEKTYAVKVRGTPGRDSLQRLRSGVRLGCDRARPARVTLTKPGPNSWLEVTVTEGRKHQVRRMLRAVGHPVVKLRRVRYAGVRLGDLRPGAVRRLSRSEVELLRRAARGGERGGAAGSGPS